jgi:hypothetical protein
MMPNRGVCNGRRGTARSPSYPLEIFGPTGEPPRVGIVQITRSLAGSTVVFFVCPSVRDTHEGILAIEKRQPWCEGYLPTVRRTQLALIFAHPAAGPGCRRAHLRTVRWGKMRCITRWISLWITLWILADLADVVGCATANLVGRSAAVGRAPRDEAALVSRETFAHLEIANSFDCPTSGSWR